MDMIIPYLPAMMFFSLVGLLLSGIPVAFALAGCGLLFGFVAIELNMMTPQLLAALPERIFGIMSNDTLLAIPFFTLMGLVLERTGMAEDLLQTTARLLGRLRGGLAYAVIVVGALLAATTGVVAASVISMTVIALPIMLRAGYNKSLATGVIAASGTLAQIIPPSLVLVVLADQLKVSVGDLYAGAVLPSAILVLLFATFIAVTSLLSPNSLPNAKQALQFPPHDAPHATPWVDMPSLNEICKALLPPLVLIFLVLGTIYLGVATPTEGGAMGALGALVLAAMQKRLNRNILNHALDQTVKLTSFVLMILVGSTVFGLTFRAIEGDIWIEHWVAQLPGGELGFLLAVNLLVFGLGFFIDFFEIVFIVVPLIVPIAMKLDIDMVWFGVLLALNLQTSFLTPPFGFALFYLKSVAPKAITNAHIYKGIVPFIVLQIITVAIVAAFPELVRHEQETQHEDTPLQLELMVPHEKNSSSKQSSEWGS